MRLKLTRIAFLFMVAVAAPTRISAAAPEGKQLTATEQKVRHELVMLPYYSVFDNLELRVVGSKVTLTGQVTRPTLRASAETVVRKLEEIESVDNQIEVLPISNNDDRIRLEMYRAIYYHPNFTRYAIRAVPPIHIIVKNGDVTLEGVVAREQDKNFAKILASSVAGVFSLKNNLRVEN